MSRCGSGDTPASLIGQSDGIARLRSKIDVLGPAPVPVVISGEAGTGKGLIARCLHDTSANSTGPFNAIDCRRANDDTNDEALWASLICSDEVGTGTIYLKDIDKLGWHQQNQLSQIITLHSGSQVTRSVRFICSTTVDLYKLCDIGGFSSDLMFLLSVGAISSLPLRDMPEDIPVLLAYFVEKEALKFDRPKPSFSKHMPYLLTHSWPGNVPELKNYAVRLTLGIELDDGINWDENSLPTLADQICCFERQVIIQYLRDCDGDIQTTSNQLAISRTTLYEKMNRYGIRAGRTKRTAI